MRGIKQKETAQDRLKTTSSGRRQTEVVVLPFGLNYLNNNFVPFFARALDRMRMSILYNNWNYASARDEY